MRKQHEEKVSELVDNGVQNLWGHFMYGVLEACGVVCGRKRGRRSE